MASNHARFVRNLSGANEPLVMLGLFQAGGTQAIKRGEMLKISGGNFVPMSADYNAAADLAIAAEEIRVGDLAGYYEIIVPRPDDVFEFDILTAAATAVGTGLYTYTSEKFQASGSNIVAYAVGQEHYPLKQNHASDGEPADNGVTVRTISVVRVIFELASSYYYAFVK
jgi:hypothetical protein